MMFYVEEYDPLEDDIDDEDWEYDEDEDYTLSYVTPDLPPSILRTAHCKCKVTINQSAYITSMLDDYGLSNCTPVKTPCATDFLAPDDGTSDACDKSLYLSIIMSLMYLARMSRPDILFPVTYLATKSANPTAHNLLQAKRILSYVKGTMSLSLTFTGCVIYLSLC